MITHNLDSLIDIENEKIGKILRDIYNRGHEIGIHPGYNTYKNKDLFMKSVNKLKAVLDRNGVKDDRVVGSIT
ncbi:MAG: hypothetical protein RMJ36_03630 [Candidatus Calescibacterium sp.]|nr:hypothetical protein [Candidatus Calescibacterium sp.]MDW8132728.1 hypothetical protein [Candidatus Calescibacterium sp.]